MKTTLVTGATGFVGANVARVLLEHGHRVRALVRPKSDRSNIEELNIDIRTGDLCDAKSVADAVEGCDEVFHIAAEYSFWSPQPELMYRSNINGTVNVMEACLRHKVSKVVYTSTVGVIGTPTDLAQPSDETTPIHPDQLSNHYKRSKFEAEKTAMGYLRQGLPLVVVNPSTPIGPWDRKPTPSGKIIVDFVNGKMPAYMNTGLNIVHVRDVALGHLLAAEKGRVGERYILGNTNISLGDIFSVLSKITGRPKPKLRIPYAVAWTAGFLNTKFSDWVTHRQPLIAVEAVKMAKKHMYFNSSKAIRELGLPQTPIEKAFEDAVAWYAAHGFFGKDFVTNRGALEWQSH